MSDNVVQTHGHCIHQVDFAGDIIFRSGKGKSVNVYSDPVSDVIHFN